MVCVSDVMCIPLVRILVLEYAYPTEKQIDIWRSVHKEKNSWMKFRVHGCPICLFLNMSTIKGETIWCQFFAHKKEESKYPFCLWLK